MKSLELKSLPYSVAEVHSTPLINWTEVRKGLIIAVTRPPNIHCKCWNMVFWIIFPLAQTVVETCVKRGWWKEVNFTWIGFYFLFLIWLMCDSCDIKLNRDSPGG